MSLKRLERKEDRLPTSGLLNMLKQSTINYTLNNILKTLTLATSNIEVLSFLSCGLIDFLDTFTSLFITVQKEHNSLL